MAERNRVTARTQALPSARATQLQLSTYGKIATIEVGNEEEKQTFYAHKGLLSFYSGYFRAALRGALTESSSDVTKLTTKDPLFFRSYIQWLYTNKIRDDALKSGHRIIIDLWFFADRRNAPLLMNKMVDVLHLMIADSWIMPIDCLPTQYMNTMEGLLCVVCWHGQCPALWI